MRELTELEKGVVEQLSDGSCKRAKQLAENLSTRFNVVNLTDKKVQFLINRIRKQAMRGNQNAVYIHLSRDGYTLQETPENLKYEGRFRLKQGTSVIMNGVFVYNRFKAISLNDYHQLRISFQPKALKTIDLLSDDYSVIRSRKRRDNIRRIV